MARFCAAALLLWGCGSATVGGPGTEFSAQARPTHHITSIAFSPEGASVAAATTLGTILLWDARTGAVRATLGPHPAAVRVIAWSPDASLLASASAGNVTLWDAATGLVRASLPAQGSDVLSLAWSPDGARIATGSQDEVIRIWERTAALVLELEPMDGSASGRLSSPVVSAMNGVRALAWSPDAEVLVAACRSRIHLHDVRTGAVRASFDGHRGRVDALSMDLGGDVMVSGGHDGTVRIWHAQSGSPGLVVAARGAAVSSVAVAPTGGGLAVGRDDGTLELWRLPRPRLQVTTRADRHGLAAVAFSPDGTRVASGGFELVLRLWDATTGVELARLLPR